MNDLENLREMINKRISGKILNKELGMWLAKQLARRSGSEFYDSIVGELLTELEGLQVERIDAGHGRGLEEIQYSEEFIRDVIKRINSKIRELEQTKNESTK